MAVLTSAHRSPVCVPTVAETASNAPPFWQRLMPFDWLALFLASWVLPLAQEAFWPLTYFRSLLFWFVPSLLLLPRFLAFTDPGGRRRSALAWAIANTVVLGIVLDLVFGSRLFSFDKLPSSSYLAFVTVPSWGVHIPIEEFIFYAFSSVAILLVYTWADEYWVHSYSPLQARLSVRQTDKLFGVSLGPLACTVAAALLGIVAQRWFQPGVGGIPLYFTVLVVFGLGPTAFLYRIASGFVNWRAFGVATLYVLVTSIVWESGLALPRGWWNFQSGALIGLPLPLWSRDLPIEEVAVWIAAPFSCVMTYETARAVMYRRRSGKTSFVHSSIRQQAIQKADLIAGLEAHP